MKVGDLVTDDFYEDAGLVFRTKTLTDCDNAALGVMSVIFMRLSMFCALTAG